MGNPNPQLFETSNSKLRKLASDFLPGDTASVWFVNEWPLASPNLAVLVVVMARTPQLTQGRAMGFGSPLGGVCEEVTANPSSGGPVVFATH